MRNLISLIIIVFLYNCSGYEENGSCDCEKIYKNGNETSVLIMGDSRGHDGYEWANLPYEVYNIAARGVTTEITIDRLCNLDKIHPDYVIVFSGPNDERELDEWDFEENLKYIEQYILDHNAIPVFIDISINKNLYSNRFDFFKEKITERKNYLFLTDDPNYYVDIFHFSKDGYKEISKKIIEFIEKTNK